MLDLLATFVGAMLGTLLGIAYLAALPEIVAGVANALRWLRWLHCGLSDLVRATAEMIAPTFTLPRWAQRIAENRRTHDRRKR